MRKLTCQQVASLGGIASGKKQRETALTKYTSAPNFCKHCQQPILPALGQKVAEVRVKQFCNKSCSAAYHNHAQPKRVRAQVVIKTCQRCSIEMQVRRPACGQSKQKFCVQCRRTGAAIGPRTKGELFAIRGGYQSARSAIRKHAAAVYALSKKPMACAICQYATHVDIAHIRSVASFSATATIAEINAPGNLVALCPTHHWEYDHGLCQIADPGVEPGKPAV